MSNTLKFRNLSVVMVLIAILTLAACEQANLDSAGGGSFALNAAKSAQGVGIPPNTWTAFTPLPFSGISGITSVSGLATNGTGLVAAAYDTANEIAYVSNYTLSGGWTSPVDLTPFLTIKPGAAHYLNGNFLVTGGSTSNYGAFSPGGTVWQSTSYIGFGTKAAVYGARYYVVAGQFGQAAYARQLNGTFTTIPETTTGWPSGGAGNTQYINTGVYTVDGYYVFGGGSGRIAYTTTITSLANEWTKALGTTSTNYPFGNNDFVNVMAYDGSTIVAVGENFQGTGIIAYSINNGLNWQAANTTSSPLILGDGIYALTYGTYASLGGSFFVAVNDSGKAAYSADGTIWTDATTSLAFSAGVNAAVYYAPTNTFLAGGSNTGNVQIAKSN